MDADDEEREKENDSYDNHWRDSDENSNGDDEYWLYLLLITREENENYKTE